MEPHTDLWLAASIVVISLLLSAFFAGAETAFTAAPRDTIGLVVRLRKSSEAPSASRTFARLDSTASIVFASRASSNRASA